MEDRKPRLLIVDDDEMGLRSLARLLRREYDVTTAPDGSEAVPLILGGSFDVVLSDVNMPAMSGDELYRRVLESDPRMALGMVLMTGDVEQPAVGSLPAGVDVLAKPVHPQRLRDALRTAAARLQAG